MILNVVNQPARRRSRRCARSWRTTTRTSAAARGSPSRPRRCGDELVDAGVLEWLRRARRRTAARCGSRSTCRRTSRSTSRWRRSRSSRWSCSTPSPRRTRSTSLSVVEAILDDPFPVLMAQANKERGEAVAEMKAEGIEYEERMELLEEVTYPKPLGRAARATRSASTARRTRGCASPTSPRSRSCATCTSRGARFTEFVAHYGLARSEGLVLRYLSNAYRALRQTVPERGEDRRARRDHRVARRDGPPDRLEPARRVGGADRSRVRGARGGRDRGRRGAAAAAADHRATCARSP